jgi:hypothetical protein
MLKHPFHPCRFDSVTRQANLQHRIPTNSQVQEKFGATSGGLFLRGEKFKPGLPIRLKPAEKS